MSETKDVGLLFLAAKKYFDEVIVPRSKVILSEVAISINWDERKAEILHGVTGRQYPERPGWQNGTADLVCILHTEELLIADWKTGGSDGATEQLSSLACGFQQCLLNVPDDGSESPKTRPVRISCLSVTEEGVVPDERALTDEQLSNHWMAMEIAWGSIGKRTKPVPGIHCSQLYCPHLAHCAAVGAIVEDAANEDDVAVDKSGKGRLLPPESLTRHFQMTDDIRDDEHAGFVMARVTAGKRQMKYYEQVIKDYVKKQNGRVLAGPYEYRETGSGFRWGKVKQ